MRLARDIFNLCKPNISLLKQALSTRNIFPMANVSSIAKQTLGDREEDRIVWIDMEMTGLDPENDQILEAACIVTDSKLRLIAKHEVVIHQNSEVLENMNEWCKDVHGRSGLVEAVKASTTSLLEAESQIVSFMKEYTMPKLCPLAGNSVHMDKYFMMKHMPKVVDHLHYRIIDVSTLKELAKRWAPEVAEHAESKKKGCHRASDDILESILELKFYQERFCQNTLKS